jgi:peptidoglycan/xylan/chitin deacetylase (PgdA/CDA1 family)
MTAIGRSAVSLLASGVRAGVTSLRSVAWELRDGHAAERGLRFLFYHRVADDRDELAVTPLRFREQMAFLAHEGYRVTDVVTATGLLRRGDCPTRVIGLSFDDGYRDVAENAMPILETHGFRATVFVVPGAVDGRAVFSWYARQPPLLQWVDIVALDRGSPLAFEAHSVTHPNLPALPDEAARAEIVDSKAQLESHLGRDVQAFCYPSGLFGSRERAFVAAAGYTMAVSCEPGVNDPATDRFALHRTQIFPHDRLLDFRAKVAGAHDSPLLLRRVYRKVRYGAPMRRSA